jgi:putative endonuclease
MNPACPKKQLEIHKVGAAGEHAAAHFLNQQGFTLLAQNYRTKRGEIDLIVQREEVIAFVEVKTRKSNYFHASLLITPAKQRKITSAAKQFIQEHALHGDFVLRFDTVFVSVKENTVEFEYVPNAFYASSQEHG